MGWLEKLRLRWARPPEGLGHRYDRQTIAVMERVLRPDSNCVDGGCHQGAILRHMVRLAPLGRHHAFEPLPEFCRRLARKFPQVKVHQVALSDVTGTAPFQHVVSNPGYSRLRPRRYDRPNERVEQIEVRTARLDDVIPKELPIDLLKTDVEGAELQVFRGGLATIQKNRPVIAFEHGLGAADYYGTEPNEVYSLLVNDCALHISLLDAWLSGRPPLTRQQFAEQFRQGTNYFFLAHP